MSKSLSTRKRWNKWAPARFATALLILGALLSSDQADSFWVGAGILVGLSFSTRRDVSGLLQTAPGVEAIGADYVAAKKASPAALLHGMPKLGQRNELTGELPDSPSFRWIRRNGNVSRSSAARRAAPMPHRLHRRLPPDVASWRERGAA